MSVKISRYENLDIRQQGTKLVIEIETDETQVDVQPSGSGKTLVIATTGGAKRHNGVSINLTVYRKR